jgi:lipoprotein-anchoring transpeptidase ErfK/SrfK
MPYAVFFRGGFAIHGTYEVGGLGHPASHGCVRLNTWNAETLFSLIEEHGYGATSIIISR